MAVIAIASPAHCSSWAVAVPRHLSALLTHQPFITSLLTKTRTMVQPRALTDDFSVSTQLVEADFAELAAAGYKTVINNRPDGEEPGQLAASDALKIAQEHGLNYVHIPVKMPELTSETVEQFSTALAESPGPILAHCKSGTRSCVLWTMANAQQNTMPLAALMQRAAQGGYDLTRLRPLIEQYASAD